MKLTNYLVQQDLYVFLNSDVKDVAMFIKGKTKEISLKLGEDEYLYYPYDNKDNMESDYKTIRKAIKKLSK